ncbi:MAG: prolipoprotein diacylglyceryl transferase [Pseudomonadota bacterium]
MIAEMVAALPTWVIPYPQIDPVALQIGPIALRWYGLAYMAGLLLGWLWVKNLLSNDTLWHGIGAGAAPLEADEADNLLFWMTIGVVVGGRLGFVFLYEPGYFLQNPLKAFAVWEGGMAFHGGVIGVALAILGFARVRGVNALTIGDLVAAATPIGLFFGRIANFINAEVVGRVTDVPWAMRFPMPDGTNAPRHPSQLYEAFLEGIVLFAVLVYCTHRLKALRWPGFVTGVFLIGYGLARIFVEFFREYDPTQTFTWGPYLTTGMVYSLPMVLIGYLILRGARFRGEAEALDRA